MYKYNPDWCGIGILDLENATYFYSLISISMTIISVFSGRSNKDELGAPMYIRLS